MARPPLKQDQDFGLDEFDSEEDLRSHPPEEEAQFASEEDLRSQRFQPEEETRSEERPAFEARFRPQPPFAPPPQLPPVIWQAGNTPKMGRASRAVSRVLIVLLAFGAGWLLERGITGRTPAGDETRAANESSPSPKPPPAALEPDTVVADRNEHVAPSEPTQSASANLPGAALEQPLDLKRVDPAAPSPEDAPPPRSVENRPPLATSAPGPSASTARSTAASRSTPAASAPRRRQPPPERRLNLEPPARPPYRSIPEPTPQRPAIVESTPPARVVQPPSSSPVTTPPSPAAVTSSPSPAAEVPAPPPRVAVDDPEVRPPATLPPEPAPAAPSTARPAVAAPPQALARPPAASSAAETVVSADVDSGAIRDVLRRYRNAFNALDATAAQQVWPSVNQRTLDRAFGRLQEQSLSFDVCTIAVKGAVAEAACSGTTRFVPTVGNRTAQTEQRQWSFSLRKATEGRWLIQNVEVR